MKYQLVTQVPRPVWLAVLDTELPSAKEVDSGPVEDAFYDHCEFRGVGLSCLPDILARGIDVSPTDAALFASEFDKAFEYGGFPKVVMALRIAHTRPAACTLWDDISPAEATERRRDYPHEHVCDGQVTVSRFADTNPAVRHYEAAYGRWIPGDAFEALHSVFVFMRPSDADSLVAVMADVMSADKGDGPAHTV